MGAGVTFIQDVQSVEEALEMIKAALPILIPLALAEFVLMLVALIQAAKSDRFKIGNKIIWVIVILCVNVIGPILYFVIGKADSNDSEGGDYDRHT
jgi:hypothetical protein